MNPAERCSVEIGGRLVGSGAPCFLIAEAGVNHDGDLELAHRLVEAAAVAGADAVKFQTFNADRVAAATAPKADYQLKTTSRDESQVEMLRRLELDLDAHRALKEAAEEEGLVFLSTPFDAASIDLLDELGVSAFKVASPDLTNMQLLEEIGRRGRPVFLSTGLATLAEVETGVQALRDAGSSEIVVLHCISEYPAAAADANLRAMATIAAATGCPVGFSDHTEGVEVALAAVALGACALERHVTLDRARPGPDHAASLEPDELAHLVAAVRTVEAALGSGVKQPTAAERRNAPVVRRSLAAASDLAVGTVLSADMLVALRPGTGVAPTQMSEIVGRRLARSVARYELLSLDDLA
jgi:N-acetylneuraminate synthase/N,N'-diacetyllegionaminate synthase